MSQTCDIEKLFALNHANPSNLQSDKDRDSDTDLQVGGNASSDLWGRGIDFRRRNLTYMEVRFWRLKSIPALKI